VQQGNSDVNNNNDNSVTSSNISAEKRGSGIGSRRAAKSAGMSGHKGADAELERRALEALDEDDGKKSNAKSNAPKFNAVQNIFSDNEMSSASRYIRDDSPYLWSQEGVDEKYRADPSNIDRHLQELEQESYSSIQYASPNDPALLKELMENEQKKIQEAEAKGDSGEVRRLQTGSAQAYQSQAQSTETCSIKGQMFCSIIEDCVDDCGDCGW
jgi:hypothetical protein